MKGLSQLLPCSQVIVRTEDGEMAGAIQNSHLED